MKFASYVFHDYKNTKLLPQTNQLEATRVSGNEKLKDHGDETSKLRLDAEPRSSLVDEGAKSIGVQKTAACTKCHGDSDLPGCYGGSDLSETCSGKSLSPPQCVDTPKYSVQQ